jgi:hypothetical protein
MKQIMCLEYEKSTQNIFWHHNTALSKLLQMLLLEKVAHLHVLALSGDISFFIGKSLWLLTNSYAYSFLWKIQNCFPRLG